MFCDKSIPFSHKTKGVSIRREGPKGLPHLWPSKTMLSATISREFFSNILNLRFIVGLVLCVIIGVACIMILTHDYQQEMSDYNLRVNLQDEFLSKYAHRNRIGGMISPSARLLLYHHPPAETRWMAGPNLALEAGLMKRSKRSAKRLRY